MRCTLFAIVILTSACAPPQEAPPPAADGGWVQTPTDNMDKWWGAEVDSSLPDILMIGDSITMGYVQETYEGVKDKYDVFHGVNNDRNTYYTLEHVDEYVAKYNDLQIIIWNNGVWNAVTPGYYTEGSPLEWFGTSLTQYENNIVSIARKLKATGARVIFMTTTEINGGPFVAGMELEMNAIAKRVLPAEGVEVHDLYQYAIDHNATHPDSYDVHYTREGNQILANFAVSLINQ